MATESSDTSHLYDGKTVRSAAPSRKKLAGKMSSGPDIPKDAVPTVESHPLSKVYSAGHWFQR